MPDLVRDHIGLRKLARLAVAGTEAPLHVLDERRVEIDARVTGTIERPHSRRAHAASALHLTCVEAQPRRPIGLPAVLENFCPNVFGVAEHRGDELPGLIVWRAGAARFFAKRLFVTRRRAAAAQNFRAADQQTRIDAERPTDETEHNDRADA
jgi:hypothetical protein